MSTFYIVSDFGKIFKSGDVLKIYQQDGTTSIIHPFKAEQIVIIGNIEITSGALKLLMHQKINIVFLNKNGRFDGKMSYEEGKNVFLRYKQYKLIDDEKFIVSHCKNIVSGKLKNQLTFMQRIRRERNIGQEFDKTLDFMKKNIENLENGSNIEQIRGYEGAGSKYYFSIYKHNFISDWAVFNGRSMNPPEDNVNAVLSFLYTLLNYRIEASIEEEGLDCYVGYLHSLDYGRKSLIFDLMEEYRTPIVDTLTAGLFNLNVLSENDFEEINFSKKDDEYPLDPSEEAAGETIAFQEKKGMLIKKEILKKVIEQFEKKIESNYYYIPLNRSISYKQIIREQVKHYKRVINGEEKEYKPLIIK